MLLILIQVFSFFNLTMENVVLQFFIVTSLQVTLEFHKYYELIIVDLADKLFNSSNETT